MTADRHRPDRPVLRQAAVVLSCSARRAERRLHARWRHLAL